MLLVAAMTIGFALVIYLGYAAIDVLFLQRSRARRRVESLVDTPAAAEPRGEKDEKPAVEFFPTVERMMATRGLTDKIALELLRAGIKLRPSEFIGIVLGATIVLALLGAVFTKNVGVELLGIVVGISVPFIYVRALQSNRLSTFNRQIPDALSLTGSALRTGYSFQRAMQVVAEEMPAPISEEFTRCLDEMNVGLPGDAALMRMVARTRSYDMELVATAVIIQMQIGGNLAEIIANIEGTIRDRVRVEAELAALTAEGKMSGVILTILPFAMAGIIYILNPKYLRPLVSEPAGIWMIVTGLCLMAIGGLAVKRMLVLDY